MFFFQNAGSISVFRAKWQDRSRSALCDRSAGKRNALAVHLDRTFVAAACIAGFAALAKAAGAQVLQQSRLEDRDLLLHPFDFPVKIGHGFILREPRKQN